MVFKIEIPISVGELIDKISILEIKASKIYDKEKLGNVQSELSLLIEKMNESFSGSEHIIGYFHKKLAEVNENIWDEENRIRDLDRMNSFDEEFIKVSRSIYRLNDMRAKIKRDINIKLGSNIIEEKGYEPY